MILLLDTSTPTCRLTIVGETIRQDAEWEAGRSLADGLLSYLLQRLEVENATLAEVRGIAVMKGPGSFTGLRIGLTVMNTLAESLAVPIVGESGEDWQEKALGRLKTGENDRFVMPEYGGVANITAPRK